MLSVEEEVLQFHHAVREGSMELVRSTIALKNNLVNAKSPPMYESRTPLMVAANFGQLEVVQYLVSKKAEVNLMDAVTSVHIE
jgi:ankyrin repeat protein